MGAHLYKVSGSVSQPPRLTAFSSLPCASTMTDKSQHPRGREGVLSTLNLAIDGLNLAKEVSSVTPAKVAFGTVAIFLTMIRVSPLLSYNDTAGSCIARTRWLTNGTTSNLDCYVLISVKRSNGGWVKRNWARSVSRCVMR